MNETPENLLKRFIERIENHKDYDYRIEDGRLHLLEDSSNIVLVVDLYENLVPQVEYVGEKFLNWETI